MIRLLTRNLGWKLLALVAAFGFWLNVASEPELATIISIPVAYKNSPSDLEISSAIVDSIDVEARGPAGRIRNLPDSHVAAVLDFASVKEPGERTFTLTPAELNLPRGLELIRTNPAQLRFMFERRATRAVPVKVEFSGTLDPGISIAQIDVEPPELTIAGPESLVLNPRKLVSDPFDLSGVVEDAERTLAVYTGQSEVRILDKPQVKVKIRVERSR